MKSMIHLWKIVKYIRNHPLNKESKGGLSRFIRFQIGSRLLPYGIVLPFVGETRLLVKRGMTGATGNFYCGLHEFEEMGFLLHLLREADVFADVGANIGSYTVLAAGVCGSRTYCFEPCLSTYRRLCDNVLLNDLSARVSAFNVAVGAAQGLLKFTETYDTTNHVVLGQSEERGAMVPVETLDEVLKEDIPCLIKIDVEGFETEVIKGADRILNSEKCVALIMEVGGGARYGFNEAALHQKVISYGFEPCSYDPFSRRLTNSRQNDLQNEIFVKNRAWVESRLKSAPLLRINGVDV